MAAASARVVALPLGSYPRWELEDEDMNVDNAEWHTIADSLVVLQSLKQSRDKWLSSAFTKFSGKSRGGKQPEVKPPPHSIKAHSRFELVVGPHIFMNTALYEIHYLPQLPASNASQPSAPAHKSSHASHVLQPQPHANGFLQGLAPPGSGETASWPSGVPADATQSRLGEWVTPALLTQVTRAVGTDPVLRNLLELAHKQQLTDEQRATLTAILRSLNDQLGQPFDGTLVPHAGPSASTVPPSPAQPFDLVIEFQEKPSDRWVVPRGAVQLTDAYAHHGASRYDVILFLHLPTSNINATTHDGYEAKASECAKLHWKGLPQTTYDILMTWSQGELANPDVPRKSSDLLPASENTYLPFQLTEGELLDALRAALVPPYPMKSIKPSNADSNRSRRKTTSRKQNATEKVPDIAAQPNPPPQPQPQLRPSTPVEMPPPLNSLPSPVQATVPEAPVPVPLPEEPAFHPATPLVATAAPLVAPQDAGPPMAIAPVPGSSSTVSSPSPVPPVLWTPPVVFVSEVIPTSSQSKPQTPLPPSLSAKHPVSDRPVLTFDVPVVDHPPPRSSIKYLPPAVVPAKIKAPPPPPAQKKRKLNRYISPPAPPPICCRACGKTDVPLLMGGRICRPCLNQGKLGELLSQPPLGSVSVVPPKSEPSDETAMPGSTEPVPSHTYTSLASQNRDTGNSKSYQENIQKWSQDREQQQKRQQQQQNNSGQ